MEKMIEDLFDLFFPKDIDENGNEIEKSWRWRFIYNKGFYNSYVGNCSNIRIYRIKIKKGSKYMWLPLPAAQGYKVQALKGFE